MSDFPPAIIQSLARQIKQLALNKTEGIRYVPTESLTEIHAEIDGPTGTPYEGGTFELKLVLGSDYPSAPPKGYFLTKVFHPNIANNGDICVNTLKKDWQPDHTLLHVLSVIRCLLIVPFPESSLNDEAAKMFMESYHDYFRKATLVTKLHAIRGSPDSENSQNMAPSAEKAAGGMSTNQNAPALTAATTTVVKKPVEADKKKAMKRL